MKFLKFLSEAGRGGYIPPPSPVWPPPPTPPKPPLPVIRPLLGEKAPRWTDETHTECGCDLCQHWSPLIEHIRYQLDDKGKELLEELVNHWGNQSDDLGVANAKLDGTWPGWEDMKNFKPKDTL